LCKDIARETLERCLAGNPPKDLPRALVEDRCGDALFGILAVFWVGSLVAGRAGGLLAALLLVLSPLYLKNSRLALLEVPALVPAALAVGAALRYQSGGRRWMLVSAVSFAVSSFSLLRLFT
jgi:hypothetical protein